MRIELIVCEKKNHVYKIKDLQVFGKMRETHIRIVNREHLVKLNFDIFLITLKIDFCKFTTVLVITFFYLQCHNTC